MEISFEQLFNPRARQSFRVEANRRSGSSYGVRLVSKVMLVTKANINVDEATHLSFLNKKCFHKKDGD